MKIEARMDEFEKVADKKLIENVQDRMTDFMPTTKMADGLAEDKEGILPFGLKRYRTCPECGEFMEIHKIEAGKAIYRCKACGKEEMLKVE